MRARLVSESYLLGGLGLRRLARALVGVRERVRVRGSEFRAHKGF